MITRLEGEEESQNSDEWQLQGGTFAGTMMNPIQHPSNGRIMTLDFKFLLHSVGYLRVRQGC